VNLDLKDFFPSIHFRRVRGLFEAVGYSGQVATVLALLCTEPPRIAVRVDGDAAACELFGKESPFRIVCAKCGGTEIEIIGEKGIDYGGETGYSPGSTVVKCINCGAAVTAWS
jgi:ribosomal protein S27E